MVVLDTNLDRVTSFSVLGSLKNQLQGADFLKVCGRSWPIIGHNGRSSASGISVVATSHTMMSTANSRNAVYIKYTQTMNNVLHRIPVV